MANKPKTKPKTSDLIQDANNANRGTEYGLKMLDDSLRTYGAGRGVLLDRKNRIIAGNKTVERAVDLEMEDLIIVETTGDTIVAVKRMDLDLEENPAARELAYMDNRVGEVDLNWDVSTMLADVDAGVDLEKIFGKDGLAEIVGTDGGQGNGAANATLQERFLVPPFSILDARQGYWQERKRAWLDLGIEGELGRPDGATDMNSLNTVDYGRTALSTTSVFDPVLCEIGYRWFCPPGGLVINPMAGESVYGLVASYLGYRYKGVELRPEQVAANRRQNKNMELDAEWICGDGQAVFDLVGEDADFLMCCPPYGDLEVYSDNPLDLSTMEYMDFLTIYRKIILESVRRMKDDRFAFFVVGDIRDKDGNYRNFVGETVRAFVDAGCSLYNEAVYITPAGTLPVRAGRAFVSGRKLGKTHQNVLVFVKGDWRAAVAACGEVEVSFPDEEE